MFDSMDANDKGKAMLQKEKTQLEDNKIDLAYMELIAGNTFSSNDSKHQRKPTPSNVPPVNLSLVYSNGSS